MLKRIVNIGIGTVLLLTAAGCAAGTGTETGGVKDEKPVTLKFWLRQDATKAMEEVFAEAQKRLNADGLNYKLDFVYVNPADYPQKLSVALAAGEEIDMVWDSPRRGMMERIAAGNYESLEKLLNQHGQNILNVRPKEMWDANKFNGNIYGIPLGNAHFLGRGVYVRKDIREKLGIAPINTYDDWIKFLYAVKEHEKGTVPLTPSFGAMHRFLIDENIRAIPFTGNNLVFYFKGNDGKVHNLFEEPDQRIIDAFNEYRKYYLDGIINPDSVSVDGLQLFLAGKSASLTREDFMLVPAHLSELQKNVPGADIEYVTFIDSNRPKITDFLQWNFISIPITSKHKEEAVKFLNWANVKENYDLLAYGIKGQHWEAVGDDKYTSNGKYGWFPYAWIWNPVQERVLDNQPENVKKMIYWARDAKNFIPDITTGFTFDTAPVANELAQFNSLTTTYIRPFDFGAISFEEKFPEFKKKAGPAAKAIQQEMQRQIDEYLKNKK
ncbi:ABC transporter substrate-binding protein [Paenibacillus piri]|uniref:Extracellular solute-binding protein n=1 Tax=Paenibacillus piri TaxID=2547395 RepID=A0A4V2ZS36_9BACL|nr:ABC transporter substrate-binding protein [Paenibacillus piri]TDF91714.1 extracellular solute-binding protein [Paenibacillus piri]